MFIDEKPECLLSWSSSLINSAIKFRNGEDEAGKSPEEMGCFERSAKVALVTLAFPALAAMALIETVARLVFGTLAALALLVTCCNENLRVVTQVLLNGAIFSLDASVRSIACIFANIFTAFYIDHAFAYQDIQLPCACDLPSC